MNRRTFFKALSITLTTPTLLAHLATKAKPIYYTKGLYKFIEENPPPPPEYDDVFDSQSYMAMIIKKGRYREEQIQWLK